MEEILSEAESEIYITGINLEAAVNIVSTIENKLKQGCSIRLLALDPSSSAIITSSNLSNVSPKIRKDKITSNLGFLKEKLSNVSNNGKLEIRIIDNIMPAGCIAIDISKSKGKIIAQHYLYHTPTDEAPTLILTPSINQVFFDIYKVQLNKIWDDAHSYFSI